MALFNKPKFDDISFETETKVNPSHTTTKNAPAPNAAAAQQSASAPKPQSQSGSANAPQARPAQPTQPAAYGIQEAIELIRKLPNVNTDIVINVVIKTLESANISVEKIVQDAQSRESRIEDRSGRLITKIEALEAEIAELNIEISQLNTELEETNKVKELLLRSLTTDTPEPVRKSQVVAKPAAAVDDAAH